jgi:hypothetical protein
MINLRRARRKPGASLFLRKRLPLEYDNLVSSFAFHSKLRPFSTVEFSPHLARVLQTKEPWGDNIIMGPPVIGLDDWAVLCFYMFARAHCAAPGCGGAVQVESHVCKHGIRRPLLWVSDSKPVCDTLCSYHVTLYG